MTSLTPQMKELLLQEIGIRFGTAAPTHTPKKRPEVWVILTGGTTYIYAHNGTAWKSVSLS